MYYHIRRVNPFGMNVYLKDDNTWTDDYNQRKVFPTLFQVEQFKKTEVVDKWGNKRVPHAIKTSIVEDADTPVSTPTVSSDTSLETWTTDEEFEKLLDARDARLEN